jgi:hypothetical protein
MSVTRSEVRRTDHQAGLMPESASPRPLGMLEASGMMLPLWEDVLPNVPDEELAAAARRDASAMEATG